MSIFNASFVHGLFQSPVQLEQIINKIPVGVIALDLDRRILAVNRAFEALTGFSLDETYGLPCYYALRSSLCMTNCPLKQLQVDAEPMSADANIITRNRQKVYVRVTAAPITDAAGNFVGYMETLEEKKHREDSVLNFGEALQTGRIIGISTEIRRIYQKLPSIAQTDSAVLIHGETGTGKDYIAESIHKASDRSRGPFIKVNCGALPELLLDSELFGHQDGAFAGAVGDKVGRFRLAHNGTLYLSEISDLPVTVQGKLLSFLDERNNLSSREFQGNSPGCAADSGHQT